MIVPGTLGFEGGGVMLGDCEPFSSNGTGARLDG